MTLVSFDRSHFKLVSRKFSNKLAQAPSCERPITALRTLFLLFANCFPIAVLCRKFMKKSVKLACHVVNSNIAMGSLPTLQISVGIFALFEKIYDGEPIVTVVSNIGEDVQYRCCQGFGSGSVSGSAWIRINLSCWIRIRTQIADPDPGGQK
jgi:hypothetical protein